MKQLLFTPSLVKSETQVDVQTKMASDQTIPDKSDFWSDRLRFVFLSDYSAVEAPCALENFLLSDYCALECHPLIRLVCARIRLSSD